MLGRLRALIARGAFWRPEPRVRDGFEMADQTGGAEEPDAWTHLVAMDEGGFHQALQRALWNIDTKRADIQRAHHVVEHLGTLAIDARLAFDGNEPQERHSISWR